MSETRNSWRTPPEPVDETFITETLTADVVIIGAGHTGTCAARGAAEAGASVICIDKQKDKQQYVLGFEIGVINSEFGKSRGIPRYETIDFLREWQRRTLNRSNPALIRRFAENCGPTLDWFLEPLDEDFKKDISIFMETAPTHYDGELNGVHGFIGTTILRTQGKRPEHELPAAVKLNQELAIKKGARFLFETSGEYLTKTGNRVTGAIAKRADGSYIRFAANKGVLLAAGDFSRNHEMIGELCPELVDLNGGPEEKVFGMGWDGRGIQMGVWAGGRLEPRPLAAMGSVASMGAGVLGNAPFMYLNSEGKRYTDEGSSFSGAQGGRQHDGRFYCIWDAGWYEQMEYNGVDHGACDRHDGEGIFEMVSAAMDDAPSKGAEGGSFLSPVGPPRNVYAADTLERLMDYLGCEGEVRKNAIDSIERYNRLAREGLDRDFGKDSRLMFPIEKPPYYGVTQDIKVKGSASMLVTVGGLWINDEQQVLDDRLDPIPGLYASGNCSGGRFGFQYITPCGGVSIGLAQTMGKLAGETIAYAGTSNVPDR